MLKSVEFAIALLEPRPQIGVHRDVEAVLQRRMVVEPIRQHQRVQGDFGTVARIGLARMLHIEDVESQTGLGEVTYDSVG